MRRALVLGDEVARHPFRQTLPAHIRTDAAPVTLRPAPELSHSERMGEAARHAGDELRGSFARHGHAVYHALFRRWRIHRSQRQPMRLTMQDGRDFLLAYCACFLAISAFIW
ncbi:hypothetical protein GTZ99_02395 [Novosphingobium sp. FSY-8]|uniref:Uncharacterized protein n=1 Tax=Novosphingobium ovatum TaxID=1908523 RepID=A0ABW9XA58_9SPHN|nr:hypothetical protein [Novosphingobium ovatum]NBC35402.1 hypothetical protein [Novosphingobium ovatum]